ncbi:UDP-4-amino-4,6-dideoxy-N-acetyl-beta-L-altrosamine transaminase [Clostridium sp. W14A]|nr:UDP-4-amino-4,6-dideoxy-N-acetyl-beta-L-altrosamine transaminase [Clostridium sp. W14A]
MEKNAAAPLAVNGGKPVRDTFLSYGRQYIDGDDIAAVTRVLKSDFLTCGPMIEKAEQKLCKVTGAACCVAVSSGTAALHTACLAAGIEAGDEVIVPPMTFAASANCVLYCGGIPVFADIDPHSWNLSPEAAEQKITDRTKAIIAVDYMGQAADLYALGDLCRKHNLILIEDAAHSMGTRYDNRTVGSIADLTAFSFHPVKTVTAGEGGAVTTNDDSLCEKARLYGKHGITREREKWIRRNENECYYEQQALGYNYRITDLQAALLCSQLDKLERFSKRRKELTAFYNKEFSPMPEIILPKEIPLSDTVRHLYVVRLDTEKLTAGRDAVLKALRAENIGAAIHYIPVYLMPYYQRLGYREGLCPNAEEHYRASLTLPLFYSMTDQDAADVVCAVKKVIGFYRKPG